MGITGRYPGLQDMTRRLPEARGFSGIVARPRLLTVAGAAAALPMRMGAPLSRLTARGEPAAQHL
jgi:hypothetical protein